MLEIVVIIARTCYNPYETTDSLQPVINATLELFLLGQEIVRRIICRSDNYNDSIITSNKRLSPQKKAIHRTAY